jgi:hypothetical protein
MKFLQQLLFGLSLIGVARVQANPILHPNSKTSNSVHHPTARFRSANTTANCFPFGTARLNQDFTPPSVSRDDWWCPQSMFYGFLGFSYPMEGDCSTDVLSQIDSDFARMQSDFGATMVRVYLPECYDDSIWIKLLEAGVKYNMAVILQVAWPLNGDPVGFCLSSLPFLLPLDIYGIFDTYKREGGKKKPYQ